MKVKFKEGKCFNFVNNSLNILDTNKDKLEVFDFLRYRNINDGGEGYIVEKELYYRGEKFYLVRTNYDMFIDDIHCNAITLISEHDVEIIDIKVGDKVKVIDDGMLYTTYGEFFIDNNLENYLMINYQYKNSNIDMDDKYIVEYIGTHKHNGKIICVIREVNWDEKYGRVYLIEINGLKKCN